MSYMHIYKQQQQQMSSSEGQQSVPISNNSVGISPVDMQEGSSVPQMDVEKGTNMEAEAKEPSSCFSDQRKKMYQTADWWSLWIGLLSFTLAFVVVFSFGYDHGSSSRVKYVVPQPMRWTSNPFDAWDVYALVGTFVMLSLFCLVYLLSLKAIGKINDEKPLWKYAKGFVAMSLIATISFWIGRNHWCSRNGLGYAIMSILIGMLFGNSPLTSGDRLSSLKLTAKDGEFFIKCSLVLLAVEFSILGDVGPPAIAVAWIGSPLALLIGFFLGTKCFTMDAKDALLISTGATWCGASAISAIGSVIGSSSSDISLSVSVVAFFTVIFTFVQPYLAMAVGMDDRIAGAWIGGSVDQTGNVIAAAAIISEEATEVAGIVKIVLNSGLGILATLVALWWQTRDNCPETSSDNSTRSSNSEMKDSSNSHKKTFSWMFLWDSFPKFVLGYILCSGILSIVMPLIRGTAREEALQRAVVSMNTWWFAIAFVGIGIGTNVKDLWQGVTKSGIIQLYLVTNMLDIGLALGLAYLTF